MAYISYPANSPYAGTPQTSWYLQNLVWRPVSPASDDQLYTLTSRHTYRPDTLSYDLYQTPAYWWVFAARNAWLRADPIFAFTAGTTLIVPSAQTVRQALGG